jgi:hypothetical protein
MNELIEGRPGMPPIDLVRALVEYANTDRVPDRLAKLDSVLGRDLVHVAWDVIGWLSIQHRYSSDKPLAVPSDGVLHKAITTCLAVDEEFASWFMLGNYEFDFRAVVDKAARSELRSMVNELYVPPEVIDSRKH